MTFFLVLTLVPLFLCVSLCQITLKIRVTVTMHLVIIFLLSALLPLSLSQDRDPFAWLYGWSQTYYFGSLQAGTTGGACPDVCDCPPSFPVAMYCDGRGLTAMPTIPSHVKYLYLQHNAITAVPDSALVNATNLVWLMMHHNQLTSEAIGEKVNLHLFSVRPRHICDLYDSMMQWCWSKWLPDDWQVADRLCSYKGKVMLLHVKEQIVNFYVIGKFVFGLKSD